MDNINGNGHEVVGNSCSGSKIQWCENYNMALIHSSQGAAKQQQQQQQQQHEQPTQKGRDKQLQKQAILCTSILRLACFVWCMNRSMSLNTYPMRCLWQTQLLG